MVAKVRARIEVELWFDEEWIDKEIGELLDKAPSLRDLLNSVYDYDISRKEIVRN